MRLGAPLTAVDKRAKVALRVDVPALGLSRTLRVVDRDMSLSQLAPMARRLADALAEAARATSLRAGRRVSCRRGCSACCRYAVPLSPPEARRIARELGALPSSMRGRVLRRFVSACRVLLAADAPRLHGDAACQAEQLSRWYAGLQLPCPLLEAGACVIYSSRPLACREHMATCQPSDCRGHQPGRGRLVDTHVSIADALGELSRQLEGEAEGAVLLPLVPAWWQDQQPSREATWPARHLLQLLAGILNHGPGVRAAVIA